MRKLLAAFLILFVATPVFAAEKAASELTWFGHAAFQLKTPSGKIILIDPWITNPANPKGKEQLAELKKADLLLVSHGHADHVGDAVEIAKKTGAKLVGTFDLGNSLTAYAGFPANQMGVDSMGNFGGTLSFFDGEVTIRLVPAVHGSTFASTESGKNDVHAAGNPGGFLITVRDGPTIYHTGDTDVFSDMSLVKEGAKVDYMLACIGGHFTMDPERAAVAAKLVEPKTVIPMHFATYPVLAGTPAKLKDALKKKGAKAKLQEMKIGDTIKL